MKGLLLQLIILAGGSLLLTLGANHFVEGASRIALRAKVSQLFIGITLVALGTSLPEFFVSLTAALKGSPDISIGNIVGSNICNIGLILGTAALIKPVQNPKSVLKFEFPLLAVVSVLLYIFCLNLTIGRTEGAVYLLLLVLFITYYILKAKKCPFEEEVVPRENVPLPKALFETVAGLAVLLVGSNLFIDSASNIARMLGISELVIGLSLVALGTSLPELASTLAAAVKGKSDIAVGNVIGSNLLNIAFIVGTVSLIKPISTKKEVLSFDIPFMLFITFLLFGIITLSKRTGRLAGAVLISLYIAYITALYTLGRV